MLDSWKALTVHMFGCPSDRDWKWKWIISFVLSWIGIVLFLFMDETKFSETSISHFARTCLILNIFYGSSLPGSTSVGKSEIIILKYF